MKKSACPVCSVVTMKSYEITEKLGHKAIWHHCKCGVMFHDDPKLKDYYADNKIVSDLKEEKEYNLRSLHYVRCYAPLIEEMCHARRMLMIGDIDDVICSDFIDRGWVADSCKETELDQYAKDGYKYDLIWINNCLQRLEHPLRALDKVCALLSKTGVLFTNMPDTDFVFTLSPQQWGNWDGKHTNIYWNRQSLCRQLENRGLDIVMARQNISYRFLYINDMHIIAQRKVV